ncbi:MAG: putative rane protein of unknown function [Micrococcaceae bacterium]|jgi:putative membrane protein|nr:putative rane protein of unknown function [Micrococcaceae bacterium]
MFKFLVRILVNALALWIATLVLPGLDVTARSSAGSELVQGQPELGTALAFVFLGLIFGIVNALIRPIVRLLALPVTVLTLGLFAIVINAAMLWLTAWLSTFTPVRLTIDTFLWTAVLAAILISVVSMVANAITGVNRKR